MPDFTDKVLAAESADEALREVADAEQDRDVYAYNARLHGAFRALWEDREKARSKAAGNTELVEARMLAEEASHGHNESHKIYAELRLFRVVMEAATEANRELADRCLSVAESEPTATGTGQSLEMVVSAIEKEAKAEEQARIVALIEDRRVAGPRYMTDESTQAHGQLCDDLLTAIQTNEGEDAS